MFFNKKLFARYVVVYLLLSSLIISPVVASAATSSSGQGMSPAERTLLINALLAQIQVLQAKLAEMQKAKPVTPVHTNSVSMTSLRTSLNPLRAQAEIVYTQQNGYQTVCENSEVAKVRNSVQSKGATFDCQAESQRYFIVVSPQANNSVAYCIDATGFSGEISNSAYKNISDRFTCEFNREESDKQVSPVTVADYTKGAKNAKVEIVTYTDLDCPFCHSFHTTLNTIVKNNSQVSVTYRHFPLVQLHPNAEELALAAECVGMAGGDTAFWKFTDALFASRKITEPTDLTKVPGLVAKAGVTSKAFSSCKANEVAARAVRADLIEGEAGGVQGTPMSFVFHDGNVKTINGAQPLVVVQGMIDTLVK